MEMTKENMKEWHWFMAVSSYVDNGILHKSRTYFAKNTKNLIKYDAKKTERVFEEKHGIHNVVTNYVYMGYMSNCEFYYNPNHIVGSERINQYFNISRGRRIL